MARNIFFPENLSPQGFITDFFTAQMYSPDFEEARKFILGNNFSKETEGKLFSINSASTNLFEKKILQTTPKVSTGNTAKDKEKMRKYVDFLTHMKPAQIAALVPYVRLYVIYKKNGESILGPGAKNEIVFSKRSNLHNEKPTKTGVVNFGGSNAGIKDLSVSRDFQYYGMFNRFSVDISYFFESFGVFANGSQYGGEGTISNTLVQNGIPQGSDYLSLIKKGSYKNKDGQTIREYLVLEYGYKFPDDIDPSIVSPEIKTIFEEQEKKELRLTCYKHDFKFSEKGEVNLNVSYVAAPEASISSRSEDKRNDPFTISKKSVLEEIFDEKAESQLNKVPSKIKKQLELLEKLNKKKEKFILDYCPEDKDDKASLSDMEKKIQDITRNINSIKKAISGYVDYYFLRYFIAKGTLFHSEFEVPASELEASSLAKDIFVGESTNQTIVSRIEKITKSKTALEDKPVEILSKINYLNTIQQLNEKEDFETSIQLLKVKSPDTKQEILDRFDGRLPLGNADEEVLRNYALYELLQTFTLSRLSAGHFLVNAGYYDSDRVIEKNKVINAFTGIDPVAFNKNTYGNFNFFPLRALIAAIMDFTIDSREDALNFPVIGLGNAITDSMGKEYFLNLGDILIETNFFKEWLYKNFIDPENFSPTMEQLISSIFESLVPSVLAAGVGHFSKSNHGYITRQVFDLSDEFLKDAPDLYHSDAKRREAALQKLAKAIKRPSKKKELKLPFIYYYQESFNDTSNKKQAKSSFLKRMGKRTFNKKKDFEDGIYHVYAGQIDGIVKSLNFDYINDPYLNTILSMRNPNHLAPYLRYSYGANIQFVGNDLYFGKTAYFAIPVNQFLVGVKTDAKDRDLFGLSGYYQINKTVDRLSMGEYTTTVTARNMYSPVEEEAKTKRCPRKKDIKGGKTTTDNKEEKQIKNYVEHDIKEYIEKALKENVALRTKFKLKLTEDSKKKKEESK